VGAPARAGAGPRARPRIGLVMPALDEEQALPLVLADLPPGRVDAVVVADNGSRDRTAEVALAAGAYVVREPRRGYGRACQAALDALFGRRADVRCPAGAPGLVPLGPQDVVAFLDADHSDHPEDIERVLAPLLAGEADLVIGSRVLGGASLRALPPHAWLGNRLACCLMRVLFGARYTDLGPFRAIRAAALERLGMVDAGFGWTVEMQLKARAARLRVREVPVRYRPRVGHSKITGTLTGTLRAGARILSWIVGWRLRLWLTPPRSPTSR
jgi:glycosyltransferase involved in cell wall biosynthesis